MNRRSARTSTIAPLESLESRLALSATPAANPFEQLVNSRGGPALGVIYAEYVNYQQSGGQGAFLSPESQIVEMSGAMVGVDIKFGAGNFLANAANMQTIGMIFTAGIPSSNLVEGFLPASQLPTVSYDPNVSNLAPVFRPSQYILPGTVTPPVPATPTTVETVALKGSQALGSIYQEFVNYEEAGGVGVFILAEAKQVEFAGDTVGVDLVATSGNFATILAEAETLGMYVTATAPAVGVIEGFLPIGDLPQVAVNAGLAGMSAIYRPTNFLS